MIDADHQPQASDRIEDAMSAALAHYQVTMGEPFPTVPKLLSIEDSDFWTDAEMDDDILVISVSTEFVRTLSGMWDAAVNDSVFLNGVSILLIGEPDEMVHLGLVWLLLHELHHFQMRHFAFAERLCLTEANAPERFGVVERSSIQGAILAEIRKVDLPRVKPCLEMQAGHDAIEMLFDAYSADGWNFICERTAAVTATMMLIEREDSKRTHGGESHPKAATRVFQLLGHVIEMPLSQAKIAQARPELEIHPAIPSDEEQSAYNS
ncbi:MAG: hypothetical protein ABJD13_07705 [Paracoccaceae bacterium]